MKVSTTALSGNLTTSALSNTQNIYRLRRINIPGNVADQSAEGSITIFDETTTPSNTTPNTIEFSVASTADAQAAFGSNNLNTPNNGIWVLERGTRTPPQLAFVSPMTQFANNIASPETSNNPAYIWVLEKFEVLPHTGSTKCYNTFPTCQDLPNYTREAPGRTHRFCKKTEFAKGHIPLLKDNYDHGAPEIQRTFKLWRREDLNVTVEDVALADTKEDDPYIAERPQAGSTREVITAPIIEFREISRYTQGDPGDPADGDTKAYITLGDNPTQGAALIVSNTALPGGMTPTAGQIAGTFKLRRDGGGLPEAALVGNLTIDATRSNADETAFIFSNKEDLAFIFSSGVQGDAGSTFPAITAQWEQGNPLVSGDAYFQRTGTNSGNLIVSNVPSVGGLPTNTNRHKITRSGGVVAGTTVPGGSGYFGKWNIGNCQTANQAQQLADAFCFNRTPSTAGDKAGSNNIIENSEWFSTAQTATLIHTAIGGTQTTYSGSVTSITTSSSLSVSIDFDNRPTPPAITYNQLATWVPGEDTVNGNGEWNDLTPIGGGTTFTPQATWTNSTHGTFQYANGANGFFCWNRNFTLTGTSPTDADNPSGTIWRIRATGVTGANATSAATGITGTAAGLQLNSGGFGGYQACLTFNGTAWSNTFGSAHTGTSSNYNNAVWHLEKQTTGGGNTVAETVATWNAGFGNVTQTAIYQSVGELAVNNTELTGDFDGTVPAGSLWRIRRADNSAMTGFGTLTIITVGSNFRVIRVGTNAEMITALGSQQITTGSGWILERQITGTAGNGFCYTSTATGAIPLVTVGKTFRLRLVNNTNLPEGANGIAEGTYISTTAPSGRLCFDLTSRSNMEIAFGSGNNINSGGGTFILEERISTGITLGSGSVDLWMGPAEHTETQIPTVSLTGIFNSVATPAPPPVITYNIVANWRQGNSANIGRGFHSGEGFLEVNNSAVSGGVNNLFAGQTYRLTRAGTGGGTGGGNVPADPNYYGRWNVGNNCGTSGVAQVRSGDICFNRTASVGGNRIVNGFVDNTEWFGFGDGVSVVHTAANGGVTAYTGTVVASTVGIDVTVNFTGRPSTAINGTNTNFNGYFDLYRYIPANARLNNLGANSNTVFGQATTPISSYNNNNGEKPIAIENNILYMTISGSGEVIRYNLNTNTRLNNLGSHSNHHLGANTTAVSNWYNNNGKKYIAVDNNILYMVFSGASEIVRYDLNTNTRLNNLGRLNNTVFGQATTAISNYYVFNGAGKPMAIENGILYMTVTGAGEIIRYNLNTNTRLNNLGSHSNNHLGQNTTPISNYFNNNDEKPIAIENGILYMAIAGSGEIVRYNLNTNTRLNNLGANSNNRFGQATTNVPNWYNNNGIKPVVIENDILSMTTTGAGEVIRYQIASSPTTTAAPFTPVLPLITGTRTTTATLSLPSGSPSATTRLRLGSAGNMTGQFGTTTINNNYDGVIWTLERQIVTPQPADQTHIVRVSDTQGMLDIFDRGFNEFGDLPAYRWTLEAEVIDSTGGETTNPPNYTYHIEKQETTAGSSTLETVTEGDGIITPESTYMKRWLYKNSNWNRRPARFKVGHINDDENFVATQTVHLSLDDAKQSANQQNVSFSLDDGVKLGEKDGALCPKPSEMTLRSDITDSAVEMLVIGVDEPSIVVGSRVNVGREIMRVTNRRANTSPGLPDRLEITRAVDGTDASDHEAGETVQLCKRWQSVNAADVIEDLVMNYADANGIVFSQEDLNGLKAGYLGSFSLTRTIPKPTGVDKLIEEIQRSVAVNMYYDSVRRELRLKSIVGLNFGRNADATPFTDDDIIKNKGTITDRPRGAVNQVYTVTGLRDATDFGKQAKDWKDLRVIIDAENQSVNSRGEIIQLTLYSRWINTTQASTVSENYLSEGAVNTSEFTFEMPIRDDGGIPVEIGEIYEYRGRLHSGAWGQAVIYPFRVLSVSPKTDKTIVVRGARSSFTPSTFSAFIIGQSRYDGDDVLL